MEKAVQEQKQLLTEVIQKLMVILGADLTLSKVRNVHGVTVSDDGTVTDMQTEPTLLLQEVIGEFVGLSGEIVKQITDLLASKQMEQKPAVDLPAAPVQPGQEQPQTMGMPTPAAVPVAPAEQSTAVMDAASASEPVAAAPEPTPAPEAQQPAMPTEPQLSHDPFPNTQPAAPVQPVATEQPTQPEPAMPTEKAAEAAPAPAADATPAPTPANQAPAADATPAQPNQNDPDMQHIINEALKQTK